MNSEELDHQEIIKNIISSRKYRGSGINRETIRNLIHQEAPKSSSRKELVKRVRKKLHNIIAPYLGEPDYRHLAKKLNKLKNPTHNSPTLQAVCREALSGHASTRERLAFIPSFYERLFQVIGKPQSLLDMACGLHPLAFPWMGLPTSIDYHAYDIIQSRVDFINLFFTRIGISPLTENRDILVSPPQIHADVGLFFKEAHRFEKRQPGCNRAFWESLQVDILAVSLPAKNLSGTHDLTAQQRELVHANLPGQSHVFELLIGNELIFIINKS